MKTKLLLLLAFFGLTVMNAQSRVQKDADKIFNNFAFAKAIPAYEKLIEEGTNPAHAYQRLAECYLYMRKFEEAIPYFKMFINDAGTPSHYYLEYAMALRSAGDEDGALDWIKRYKKFNKNDPKVKRLLKDGGLASVVFNSNEKYEVEPVHFNTEYSEFGAHQFDGDIYFSSSRIDEKSDNENLFDWNGEPWLDIFVIPADNKTAVPERMKGEINSEFHEGSLAFSTNYKNDTILYFTRNNYFDNEESFFVKKTDDAVESHSNLKIFIAEKEDGKWKTSKELGTNADHYSTGHPSVNSNRSYIYFSSDRPGGYGGADIYYAQIHERGGIMSIKNAGPVVNTPGDELFPFVNNDGQLFFASDGHPGYGMLDVFGTVLNDEEEIIDVINLGKPLNSEKDDFAYFGLENGIDGYISSNRKGGKGGDDIYKFRYSPTLTVEGQVTDAINFQPLDSVSISLVNKSTGNVIATTMTDAEGNYNFFVNRNRNYNLVANRKTHPEKTVLFSTVGVDRSTKRVSKDIVLEPVLDVKILAGLNKIYFDYDKSNIRPDAARELDKVIKLLVETYPGLVISLESHTDPVGGDDYNLVLSEARAKSTYEYLITNGVPRNRILEYKGYGETRPVNDCKTKFDCPPEILELNRRTEFPIVKFISKETAELSVDN